MSHAQYLEQVDEMVAKTAPIRYQGVSVGAALKVPIGDYCRTRLELQNRPLQAALFVLRRWAVFVYRVVAGVCFAKAAAGESTALGVETGKGIVMICDHPGHVERMALDLLHHFPPQDVVLVTTSPQICGRMKSKFPACLDVYPQVNYYRLRRFAEALRLFLKFRQGVGGRGWLFSTYFFPLVYSLILSVDYYTATFRRLSAVAVMTMSDNHFNEYIATAVAQRLMIPTYTNQHGELTDLTFYLPVSDCMFVWGDRSRERLLHAGVPPSQVVVSGNPKYDRVHADILPRRKAIRDRMVTKYGLDPCRPVITYLSPGIYSTTDLGPEPAFTLFKCFSQACALPANFIAKLHPYQDSPAVFREWIERLELPVEPSLLQDDDLFEVLCITDIAVTFHSTTGVEAIGFGIPCIVLNIIPDIDVRNYITFVEDSLQCKTADEFRLLITKLVMEPESLAAEVERTGHIRGKYFRNESTFNTSAFVYNHIVTSGES